MKGLVLLYFNHICIMIEKIPRTNHHIVHILSREHVKVQRTSKIPSFLSKAPSLFFSSTCRRRYEEYSLFQRDILFDSFSKYLKVWDFHTYWHSLGASLSLGDQGCHELIENTLPFISLPLVNLLSLGTTTETFE